MDINIRELGVNISNKILNIKDSIVHVKDLNHLNNIIAECDEVTKKVILDAFKKSKSKTNFVESIGGLIDEYGEKLDFSTVSGPEIHSMELDEEPKEETKENINIDDVVEQYAGKKAEISDADALIDDILKNYSYVEKKESNNFNIDDIVNQYATPKEDQLQVVTDSQKTEKNVSTNVVDDNIKEVVVEQETNDDIKTISENIKQENDYVVDPSYEKKPLLERLQKINSEGPIFVDESRILDKDLNVNNAISLGKINTKPLNVKPEPMKVDVSKNAILEMNKKLCDTFKNACNKAKEKLSKFKIKEALNIAGNSISKAGTFLAEMPKNLSYKISDGSKKLRKAAIIKDAELSTKREQLIDQLKEIKQSYVDGYNNTNQDDIALSTGKTM